MPRVVQRIRVPTKATLTKYGLTAEEWRKILRGQGDVCAICKKFPDSGKLMTDHEHVAGFRKMPPELRRMYVRGVICNFCNLFIVRKQMTLSRAIAAVAYLRAYHRYRPKDKPKRSRT